MENIKEYYFDGEYINCKCKIIYNLEELEKNKEDRDKSLINTIYTLKEKNKLS